MAHAGRRRWRLVRRGITNLDEVLSVTTAKEVASSARAEKGEALG
jgi:hypothetical protein